MRNQIAKIVEDIVPLDDREKADQAFVRAWIASGKNIFRIKKPATPDTHLVSFFVPFDKEKGKILLVHHKKADAWIPPGGHVDIEEHPRDTVCREMKEELFVEADFYEDSPLFLTVNRTYHESSSHIDVSFWYVVRGNSKYNYSFDSREFYAISWFPIEQMAKEPTVKRFLYKLQTINRI